MTMTKLHWGIGLATLLAAGSASAAQKVINGEECVPAYPSSSTIQYSSTAGIRNNSTAGSVIVYCPIENPLTVAGTSANMTATVRVYGHTTGFTCQLGKETGFYTPAVGPASLNALVEFTTAALSISDYNAPHVICTIPKYTSSSAFSYVQRIKLTW